MTKDRYHEFAFAIQKAVLVRKQGQTATDVLAFYLELYECNIRQALADTVDGVADVEASVGVQMLERNQRVSETPAFQKIRYRVEALREVSSLVRGRPKVMVR